MPTQAELFASVFVLAQHLAHLGDAELAGIGLTTKQWLLLAVLHRGFPDRDPTLSEAATLYGSSRQNVKAIASKLVDLGYLNLIEDPSDRRAVRLRVTAKTAVFDSAEWMTRERAFFARVFGGLDTEALPGILELVTRWIAALSPAAREALGRNADLHRAPDAGGSRRGAPTHPRGTSRSNG